MALPCEHVNAELCKTLLIFLRLTEPYIKRHVWNTLEHLLTTESIEGENVFFTATILDNLDYMPPVNIRTTFRSILRQWISDAS